jgi:hypothetical protein
MNQFLSSAPLTLTQWGHILAVGLAGYALVEVEKWIRRRGEVQQLGNSSSEG